MTRCDDLAEFCSDYAHIKYALEELTLSNEEAHRLRQEFWDCVRKMNRITGKMLDKTCHLYDEKHRDDSE